MLKNKTIIAAAITVSMITSAFFGVSAEAATKKTQTTKKSAITKKSTKRAVSSNGTYTVKKGDNLSVIARDLKTTVANLKNLNKLKSDKLQIGKVLKVTSPVAKKTTKTAAKSTTSTKIKAATKSTVTAKAKTAVALSTPNRGSSSSSVALDWWTEASKVFSVGTVAKVIDVHTGKSFNVKRTYGHNHADCEALTSKDSAIIKDIWGGWSWDRRPVIVQVGDTRIAASMAGMPHAGLDNYSALRTVSSRSGGFGRGLNYDAVKDNGMNGHFDIHFLNSKTHGTGRVDAQHQAAIRQALGK
jgi:LysM repeat protein